MREGTKAPVWVALVLALALVGAACSSDTSEPGDTGTTSAAPTGGTFSVQICEPQSHPAGQRRDVRKPGHAVAVHAAGDLHPGHRAL